jgi:hypothetical protein
MITTTEHYDWQWMNPSYCDPKLIIAHDWTPPPPTRQLTLNIQWQDVNSLLSNSMLISAKSDNNSTKTNHPKWHQPSV